MNEQQVYEKVVTLIKPYAKNQEAFSTVSKDSKILEDLQVNSARLVDIILAMEDEFNIEVKDEEADGIWTINDAVNVIKTKIQ